MRAVIGVACRHFEMDLAEACHAYGVRLVPYGVTAGGYLTGKYLRGQDPKGCRHSEGGNGVSQGRYASERCEKATLKYEALAKRKGLSCTELAVAWCARRSLRLSLQLQSTHAAA